MVYPPTSQALVNVERAMEAIRNRQMVIMTDDKERENEGDLVFAAEDVSAEKINFMAKEARGLICLSLEPVLVERLQLPMMIDHNKALASLGTAFTVSIEAKKGVTTGISAADRAQTVRVAIDDRTTPEDLVVPGHIFPLRAKQGGVLERAGQTEGSVDLCRLAGRKAAAVICEVMKDDGNMARLRDLEIFSEKHNIPILSIADLIAYRLSKETLVSEIRRTTLKLGDVTVQAVWLESLIDKTIHCALVKGDPSKGVVDVRVHRQNPLADILPHQGFTEALNGGRWKVDYGLNMLMQSPRAVFLYLGNSHPRAMLEALDPQAMDPRLYGIGAQILKTLGVQTMNLHVSSERHLAGLHGFGLEIKNTHLLSAKREREPGEIQRKACSEPARKGAPPRMST
ncbi:MAG: 3,4-dihydroxy-2-butanone-4-phosphate synthase [Deltaproteobacteria bacterium]|nr:3,4-dihydroxy-2-butanone-4-phosphate synthase [Deltaproteobacteria bacterium]